MKFKNIKRLIIILIVLTLIFTLVSIFYYSPKVYTFKEYTYYNEKINTKLSGTKIAYISDVHLSDADSLERFKTIIEEFNEYPVDLIIFGGDLYEEGVFKAEEVSSLLKTTEAKYGKFAILGDKDLKNETQVTSVLNNGGFEVLDNEQRTLYINNTTINFVIASLESDTSKIKLNDKTLTLAVSHTPDTYTLLKDKADLQLSGHSLGGMIHLPLIGSLIKEDGAKTYTHGIYNEDNSSLYICNGLTPASSFKYRIGTKNEIMIITLKSK